MNGSSRVWGLHCDVDVDLVEGGFAAMGWDGLGNLNELEPDREAFKNAMSAAYPDAKARTISQWAGQVYRFVHGAQDGDVVVYREFGGGPINLGMIQGPYERHEGELYGQRRPVNWTEVGLVPGDFPPGAIYELGASLTWFRIKKHRHIWVSALEGEP